MPSRDEILDSYAVVPEGVVMRAFESETLMLNLSTGQYHGVDGSGARLVELLGETGGDVRESVRRLAEESGVAAEGIADEQADFVAALAERGLLEVAPR